MRSIILAVFLFSATVHAQEGARIIERIERAQRHSAKKEYEKAGAGEKILDLWAEPGRLPEALASAKESGFVRTEAELHLQLGNHADALKIFQTREDLWGIARAGAARTPSGLLQALRDTMAAGDLDLKLDVELRLAQTDPDRWKPQAKRTWKLRRQRLLDEADAAILDPSVDASDIVGRLRAEGEGADVAHRLRVLDPHPLRTPEEKKRFEDSHRIRRFLSGNP